MNTDKLSQWLTLAANVGVIAGIFFLGVEMQQNNEFLAANSKYNMHLNQVSMIDQISSSPQLSELLAKARMSENLTPGEQVQLQFLAIRTLRNWMWEFEEYQAGRIELEQIPLMTWRNIFLNDAIPIPLEEIWSAGVYDQNPAFTKFINENVAK